MNPNGESSPNFEIPKAPAPETGDPGQEQAVEAPAASAETAGKRPAAPIALPPIPDDIPSVDQPVIAIPPQDVVSHTTSDPQSSASDSDRIEPFWIKSVKDTVARTHDDPYIQSAQVSKIKADYNLKRFNKAVKTDDQAA